MYIITSRFYEKNLQDTQPNRDLSGQEMQKVKISNQGTQKKSSKIYSLPCCSIIIVLLCLISTVILFNFLNPRRTNILLLGIDYAEDGSFKGRSDTIILTTVLPAKPYIGMISIPRDLWVSLPSGEENRINTAHFFAEIGQEGSGPLAVSETIANNFGVKVDYFIRIRFEGFKEIVDAMDGITITLDEPMAGYSIGSHYLNGNKALAFVRNRSGTDDFYRMQQGQMMLKAFIKRFASTEIVPNLPRIYTAVNHAVDTNIPAWQIPRLSLALFRASIDGIDNRIITREMTTPYTTDQGAAILLPNWEIIHPLFNDVFKGIK